MPRDYSSLFAGPGMKICPRCEGSCYEAGIIPLEECSLCEGTGEIPDTKFDDCPKCNGAGVRTFHINGATIQAACSHCNGSAVVKAKRQYRRAVA